VEGGEKNRVGCAGEGVLLDHASEMVLGRGKGRTGEIPIKRPNPNSFFLFFSISISNLKHLNQIQIPIFEFQILSVKINTNVNLNFTVCDNNIYSFPHYLFMRGINDIIEIFFPIFYS
jgi:hypothetical protein